MKIFFFGAGKVGLSLASVFRQSGLDVTGIFTRSKEKALTIKRITGVDGIHRYPERISLKSDIVFFTVPDREINAVSIDCYRKGWTRSDQIWAHCSGSLDSTILKINDFIPAGRLSIHPAQTFATPIFKKSSLKNITYAIEGNYSGINAGIEIVKRTGARFFEISADQKPLYHAACVICANFLVAIEDSALTILTDLGINENDALRLIYPLAERTLKNFAVKGSARSLSGPARRGDTEIIKSHLKNLSHKYPDIAAIYKILTERLMKILM
jgi:predicted short-subunit dehydrogenase-like oxidoreductase (DUF2520 family)